MMKSWIQINRKDNVIIALESMKAGTQVTVADTTVTLRQDIAKGHKIAIKAANINEPLVKYGEHFAHATMPIQQGEWVHSHNVKTNLSDTIEYRYQPEPIQTLEPISDFDVEIYRRKDGQIATRNELWIIPTVGCVNGTAQLIAKEFLASHDVSSIDGVHVFPHQFGCSQLGDDHEMTKALLQSMATHPNAGGVLVIGLGCENNQIEPFADGLDEHDPDRIRFMVAQSAADEIAEGVALLTELFDTMKHDQRKPGKLSEVKFGLECGGSDGLSGITANPLLGLFSNFYNALVQFQLLLFTLLLQKISQ